MTAPLAHFTDLSGKKFSIPVERRNDGIINAMVFERGTRIFAKRLADAGYLYFGDLHEKCLLDIIKAVPTTRRNLDRSLHYMCAFGRQLI